MKMLRPLVAEFIGTFFLCFACFGAIVTETYRTGSLGLIGIAAAQGIALAVGVTATMHVSGGHLNPAVTLGALSIGRINVRTAGSYIVAQLLAASAAAFAVKGLYPAMAGLHSVYGAPKLANDISLVQGIVIEAIATFLLAFAVMGTAVDARAPKMGGLFVGLTLFFAVLAMGNMTGGALNPARAFGPELAGWNWTGAVVYWVGPILGAVLAAQVYELVLLREHGRVLRDKD
jgi:MIP family channel proteins